MADMDKIHKYLQYIEVAQNTKINSYQKVLNSNKEKLL